MVSHCSFAYTAPQLRESKCEGANMQELTRQRINLLSGSRGITFGGQYFTKRTVTCGPGSALQLIRELVRLALIAPESGTPREGGSDSEKLCFPAPRLASVSSPRLLRSQGLCVHICDRCT